MYEAGLGYTSVFVFFLPILLIWELDWYWSENQWFLRTVWMQQSRYCSMTNAVFLLAKLLSTLWQMVCSIAAPGVVNKMGTASLHFQSVCEENLDKVLNDSKIYTKFKIIAFITRSRCLCVIEISSSWFNCYRVVWDKPARSLVKLRNKWLIMFFIRTFNIISCLNTSPLWRNHDCISLLFHDKARHTFYCPGAVKTGVHVQWRHSATVVPRLRRLYHHNAVAKHEYHRWCGLCCCWKNKKKI